MSQQLNAIVTIQKISLPEIVKAYPSKTLDLDKIKGTWIIDLRPNPNSKIYLKEFIITLTRDKSFRGEFYGTAFAEGKFNTEWEYVYFAFTTSDKENIYYHSGYIDGDKIF